jgi:hypothetical protein
MSQELENNYCVMGDQVKRAVVLWATVYCVMGDRLLCFGRPLKAPELNVYKAFFKPLTFITIYITTWSVDNIEYQFNEVGL